MNQQKPFVTPEDVQAQLRDQADRNEVEVLGKAFDQILAEVPRNVISEAYFKEFVPLFRDGIKEQGDVNLENAWIGIAGSAMDEVIVVDDEGKQIGIVPGLLDTTVVDARASMFKEGSIQAMLVNHEREVVNMPFGASARLAANLINTLPDNVNVENPLYQLRHKEWKDFMARYGAPAGQTTKSEPEENLGFDFSEEG